jgi:hypothetical protein
VRSAGQWEDVEEGLDIARLAELQHLAAELRLAIESALRAGLAGAAVALDAARLAVEAVLTARAPSAIRAELARTRGEVALESWRLLRH